MLILKRPVFYCRYGRDLRGLFKLFNWLFMILLVFINYMSSLFGKDMSKGEKEGTEDKKPVAPFRCKFFSPPFSCALWGDRSSAVCLKLELSIAGNPVMFGGRGLLLPLSLHVQIPFFFFFLFLLFLDTKEIITHHSCLKAVYVPRKRPLPICVFFCSCKHSQSKPSSVCI